MDGEDALAQLDSPGLITQHVMSKPFDVADLVSHVERLIGSSRI